MARLYLILFLSLSSSIHHFLSTLLFSSLTLHHLLIHSFHYSLHLLSLRLLFLQPSYLPHLPQSPSPLTLSFHLYPLRSASLPLLSLICSTYPFSLSFVLHTPSLSHLFYIPLLSLICSTYPLTPLRPSPPLPSFPFSSILLPLSFFVRHLSPETSYAATYLINSSPFPVAETAHVRSLAYVPAPMIEVSPVRW